MDNTATNVQSYAIHEQDFRSHYQEHHAEFGGLYAQYRPAYRYGYDLGVHPCYGSGTWVQIEAEVRTLWEARNPGTWHQFKGCIRYAWAMASGEHECVAYTK